MRINEKDHLKYNWRVHELLPDFEIEDVWRFPIVLEDEESLTEFRNQFKIMMDGLTQQGVAGFLFKLRFFIGGLLGWDEVPPRDHLIPGSIRERYAKAEGLTFREMPEPGEAEFTPVYAYQKEALQEIENETVHALMHLGRVPHAGKHTVQMTVYVKPKGVLGRLYMSIIKPFRIFIVYPTMFRMARKHWIQYKRMKLRGYQAF